MSLLFWGQRTELQLFLDIIHPNDLLFLQGQFELAQSLDLGISERLAFFITVCPSDRLGSMDLRISSVSSIITALAGGAASGTQQVFWK